MREVYRRVACLIAGADDKNSSASHRLGLAYSRAIQHPTPDEFLDRGDAEAPVPGAGRNDDCARHGFVAPLELDHVLRPPTSQSRRPP